ncbi:MAG: (5-formylfuran-3-yl)methyl phosphate synthase [Pirellulaceae bacterium]
MLGLICHDAAFRFLFKDLQVTGLLVSVRDADEATAALRGGAALIDVKEPRHGSLGRATAEQWRDVSRQVAGQVPVSVACGELVEFATRDPVAALPDAPEAYVKCGLAGCGGLADWPQRWAAWLEQLPPAMRPVAVAYADWNRALAPPPEQICEWAVRLGCRAMLWDTHTKDGSCLFDHLTGPELIRMTQGARQQGMLVVLAGSLTLGRLPEVMSLAPDYVAVRGAVCVGDREGVVREHLVERFASAVEDYLAPASDRHSNRVRHDSPRGHAE